MKCSSCKNISFDNCPTYQDLFESPHLDFYYEELEQDISDDPKWEEGDNLMAVIHCYECGTTRKANGEIIKNGLLKEDIPNYNQQEEEIENIIKQIREQLNNENN